MSNSQLDKLKSRVKNGAKVTLKLSWNVVGAANEVNNFLHKLLLTNTQVSRVRKAFANNPSVNTKLSKTHLHKIAQSGEILGILLGLLLKPGFPLIRNVLKPLTKSVLISLGLTVAASAADAAILHKRFGSGMTTLIISNEEMTDIMKIVKSLEESG